MIVLQVSEELGSTIQNEAEIRGVSIEDYLESVIQREKTLSARRKIEQEQAWWINLPLSQRAKYENTYIAVHNEALVDHDVDEQALYKRIRAKYGKTPILIMPAEGPRELHIFSPQLAIE